MPSCCPCNGSGRCKNCSCVKEGRLCTSCLPGRKETCSNITQVHAHGRTTTPHPNQTNQTRRETVEPEGTVNTSDHTTTDCHGVIPPAGDVNPPYPTPAPLGSPMHAANSGNQRETATLHARSMNSNDSVTSLPYKLPSYITLPSSAFVWSESVDGADFTQMISAAYAEVVHWRHNLFLTPSGKAGKLFTSELARLFRAYGEGSGLEPIALKAAMVMPALLLQKPHSSSKAREHVVCLQRRLDSWQIGDINNLVIEGRTIQHRLKQNHRHARSSKEEQTTRLFTKLMLQGKVRAALRILTNESKGGPLPIDTRLSTHPDQPITTVRDELLKKHPPGQPAHPDALISSTTPRPVTHRVVFDCLDGASIRTAALHTNGSAGPSGIDSTGWRRLCTSFQNASADLCNSLASVARKLCTNYVDPRGIAPLTASRLIALDKCPGVRPIGIGETSRRIIGKAILAVIKYDILEAAGSLQLCAGQEAGSEAAIHAMRSVFQDEQSEAVLLVDATNAFNSLNRQAALQNIHHLCPSLATVITNTYREDIQLFIDGETLLSCEGTTQGDPLAMAMYAIGILPLINQLQSTDAKQVWFADDATASGRLEQLHEWWVKLNNLGPAFGYFANPSKTWLIVKEKHLSTATERFLNTGVNITTEGKRHLGAALGSRSFVVSYIQDKVKEWTSSIQKLASIATTQPHAAYSAFTHGLASKWTYFLRTIPEISDLLQPLEEAINLHFIPALTGKGCVTTAERDLFALPTRLGSLGLTKPTDTAAHEFSSSQKVTAPLATLILLQQHEITFDTIREQQCAKAEIKRLRQQKQAVTATQLRTTLPTHLQRAMELGSEKGASSWLSVLPIEEHGFALHKGAFRDALCLRYNWQPANLPNDCVCGHSFSVDHALSCSTGGFPSIRHNELRDFTAKVMTEVCHDVCLEPTLQPLTGETLRYATANTEDGAHLDISAQGFWDNRYQRAFFDVRVFNPNAQTHRKLQLASVYRKQEREKQRTYEQRIREVELGTFTPLVFSTSGGMAKSASVAYKRLASLLARKRDQPYSLVIAWLRCHLSFSLLRSAITCLRGARSSSGHAAHNGPIDLVVSEGQVPLEKL